LYLNRWFKQSIIIVYLFITQYYLLLINFDCNYGKSLRPTLIAYAIISITSTELPHDVRTSTNTSGLAANIFSTALSRTEDSKIMAPSYNSFLSSCQIAAMAFLHKLLTQFVRVSEN